MPFPFPELHNSLGVRVVQFIRNDFNLDWTRGGSQEALNINEIFLNIQDMQLYKFSSLIL